MLTLSEKEICPKKDNCMFAKVGDDICHGLKNRNSTFVCDLDFSDEVIDFSTEPLQCSIQP